MTPQGGSTGALIDELMRSMSCHDAESAIRAKAAGLLDRYVQQFGEPEIPISVEVLASLCGITRSNDAPIHSDDAELVPDGQGGMTMHVNADRPETRQRFSVAHEISHTFFPNYAAKEWCRTDARYRSRENPDDYLEMLCDIGAAELLFPQPWFGRRAQSVIGAAELVELAAAFHGSREATLRRYAETSQETLAVAYFTWKLKPKQQPTVGNRDQRSLFGENADQMIRDAMRLRIDYSIPSPSFRAAGHFLPNDKSVASSSPIYEAGLTGETRDGECHLDLGQASGMYRIWAVPLWTPNEARGADGEWSVAAVLRPLAILKPAIKREAHKGPTLFDKS